MSITQMSTPTLTERPIILVVDDEESVRRSFDLIFRDDYEVVTVPDGETAVAKVRDLMPNLMFLDIRMPGMNGLEVLAQVREIDQDVEVVVVTAVTDKATAIEAMKLGAFNYVVKPFDVDAIQQLASRALLKHRINLENRRFLESLTHENERLKIQRMRLVQKLQAARRDLMLPATLAKLDKFDCLILDDLGYVRKDQAETAVLFELIAERYERKSLIITCNQPFSEWNQIFPDPAVTVAAIDRLVHHSTILEINTESYRRRTAAENSAAANKARAKLPA